MLAVLALFLSYDSFSQDTLSLQAIDELIQKQEYNEALRALARYQQQKPEDFDAAQKRVRQIMKEREKFNTLAKQLVERMDAVEESAEEADKNDAEKVLIITDMELSESRRSEESVSLTNDARRTLALQYYITRAEDSMKTGSALVSQGERDAALYAQAATVFARCLTLKTAESDVVYDGEYAVPVEYDKKLLATVSAAISAVGNEVDALSSLFAACQNETDAFLRFVQQKDADHALLQLASLEAAFGALARARGVIVKNGETLALCDNRVLTAYPGLVTSYISFALLAVTGDRADAGIVEAIDAFWRSCIEAMQASLSDTIQQFFSAAASQVPVKQGLFASDALPKALTAARDEVAGAHAFSKQALRVQALSLRIKTEEKESPSDFDSSMRYVADYLGSAYTRALTLALDVASQNAADATGEVPSTAGAGLDAAASAGSAEAVPSDEAFLDALLLYKTVYDESCRALTDSRLSSPVDAWKAECALYAALVSETAQECLSRFTADYLSLSQRYATAAAETAERLERAVLAAETLAGFQDDVSTKHYPLVAEKDLATLSNAVSVAQDELSLFVSRLLPAVSAFAADSPFFAHQKTLKETADFLAALKARIALSQEKTVQRAEQAELTCQQGDDFYRQAENALSKSQFDSAVDFLTRARERYSTSLTLSYDEALQDRTDRALLSLDAEITSRQHVAIVAEVRALKTQARRAYYEQDFATAENRLVEASERWAKTSIEEDSEIKDLLTLVNTALSMSSERTIPESAPQYAEMSSLLSLAHLRFNDGEALLSAKKTAEAKKMFDQEQEQIRKVQSRYPLNREASLLSLKITQLLQPDTFEKTFAALVKKALSSSDKKTAYATLTDLYALNPRYPKLASHIENLEYELGIRKRPLDNAAKKKSEALISQAATALKTAKNDETKLRTVLQTVDSALSVDPDNAEAMKLKDSVQSSLGPQVTNILSAEDETVYLIAIQELNKNNIIRSYTMIEQLMQKDNNSSNRKLQQLMKRIKALM